MLVIAVLPARLHLPFLGVINVVLAGGIYEARDVRVCFSVVADRLVRSLVCLNTVVWRRGLAAVAPPGYVPVCAAPLGRLPFGP